MRTFEVYVHGTVSPSIDPLDELDQVFAVAAEGSHEPTLLEARAQVEREDDADDSRLGYVRQRRLFRVVVEEVALDSNPDAPRATLIEYDVRQGRRLYRLDGGKVADSWLRPGKTPWCWITVYDNNNTEPASYGGEVWPIAWPEYFVPLPSTVSLGSGRIQITAAGLALLANARPAAELDL